MIGLINPIKLKIDKGVYKRKFKRCIGLHLLREQNITNRNENYQRYIVAQLL